MFKHKPHTNQKRETLQTYQVNTGFMDILYANTKMNITILTLMTQDMKMTAFGGGEKKPTCVW
jgi:hypothetical protein